MFVLNVTVWIETDLGNMIIYIKRTLFTKIIQYIQITNIAKAGKKNLFTLLE